MTFTNTHSLPDSSFLLSYPPHLIELAVTTTSPVPPSLLAVILFPSMALLHDFILVLMEFPIKSRTKASNLKWIKWRNRLVFPSNFGFESFRNLQNMTRKKGGKIPVCQSSNFHYYILSFAQAFSPIILMKWSKSLERSPLLFFFMYFFDKKQGPIYHWSNQKREKPKGKGLREPPHKTSKEPSNC